MKKRQIIILLLSVFFGFADANAGVILKSGDLSVLKSEKVIGIQFDYSNMTVGKDLTEDEYVNQKVKDYNAKEPGKGDKWKEGWIKARKDRYEPKFIELYNKDAEGMPTVMEVAPTAKYTLIVKTVYTEPGFNIGIMRESARANFVFLIVETANPSNVIAELYANKVPGAQAMGYDFDAGSRIAESYAKAGKMLNRFILKAIKK